MAFICTEHKLQIKRKKWLREKPRGRRGGATGKGGLALGSKGQKHEARGPEPGLQIWLRPQRSLEGLLRKSCICVPSWSRGLGIPGSFYLGSTSFPSCPSPSGAKANVPWQCLPLHSEDTVLCFRYDPSLQASS